MAYAQELKNLVAEIKTGHQDRTQDIKDVKDTTHELVARFHGELKEMARNLKDFLGKSEDTRKKDFDVMIKAIQAQVRDIKKDTADLMKDIKADIDVIRKDVGTTLTSYKAERKEAAGYWAKLKTKEETAPAAPKAAAPKKKSGKKK